MYGRNKLRIETELDNSGFLQQYKKLESKAEELKTLIETAPLDERVQDWRAELERTENRMQKLVDSTEEVEEANDKTFKKGVKSLTRFGLALFGIRSIFAMVSRASSAYLSQNTELAQKLQSVWVGLGSFLAPAIEMISDTLLKGLGYLNEFVKALTGIDFIARANAKALQTQANAQKQLNRQTYSFDEMNIQSTGSGSSSTSGLIQVPELDSGIITKIKELAKWLKENWEIIKDIGIAIGVVYGVIKIAQLFSNLKSLIALLGTAGLTGVLAALAILITVDVVKAARELTDNIEKLNKQLENNTILAKDSKNKTRELSDTYWNLVETQEATEETTKVFTDALTKNTESISKQKKVIDEQLNSLFLSSKQKQELAKQEKLLSLELEIVLEDYRKLYEQGKLNDEQTESYKKALSEQIILFEDLGKDTSELREEYRKLSGEQYRVSITADLNDNTGNGINSIRNKLSNLWNEIISSTNYGSSGLAHGGGGRGFATGGVATIGSIVNNPGRGVSYGNARVGENGKEGIIPLTDPNAMAELGETIGRYITVNLTNITKIGSRTMNREIKIINAENDFAVNR